jgi:MFS family permease
MVTYIDQSINKEKNLGKVFGFLDSFESGSLLLSMGLSGLLAECWGIRLTFYILALLYLTAGVIGVYLLRRC